ncbi:50S ribosomal protein L24 [Candidatus Microgenomates bacterium]|nr:MAG: 50S ribosomal protein L24 [Candidatus Microgenomates bacterium]
MKNSKLQFKIQKLKKGDEVKVTMGKDKGKTGKIEKVFVKTGKILVNGVNQYKKHMKAKSQTQKSEIVTITKPLPIPNVAFVCPKCHLPTRVGFSVENNKKTRVCKKCKQII